MLLHAQAGRTSEIEPVGHRAIVRVEKFVGSFNDIAKHRAEV
jgi:hypothetical protein